jgi:dihydroxyacid dehydratase/phosphogluconate dehydratase
VASLGGSTNAVLHLLAIAAEALHATLGTAGREPEAAPVPALEG